MKKNAFAIIALVLLFTSSSILAQKNTNIEKNKDFLEVYTEDFWNNHNLAAFDKYFTSNYVYHSAEGDMNGEITTDDLIAEGDKVTKIWTAHGTHKGDLMGIPATGKPINVKGIEVFRLADGKIAELWASMDNLGMLQQLGIIPPLGE